MTNCCSGRPAVSHAHGRAPLQGGAAQTGEACCGSDCLNASTVGTASGSWGRAGPRMDPVHTQARGVGAPTQMVGIFSAPRTTIGAMKRMLRARGPVVPCIVVAAAASVVACRSDETIAREQFASRFTCPEERITVTPRKDLTSVDLTFRPQPPPSDVAADPGRLELWNKDQARRAAEYEGKSVVEARGCGHELLFICGQMRVSVGATRYLCMSATYPPTGGTHADAGASSPR
jgi:hypothetical protein